MKAGYMRGEQLQAMGVEKLPNKGRKVHWGKPGLLLTISDLGYTELKSKRLYYVEMEKSNVP